MPFLDNYPPIFFMTFIPPRSFMCEIICMDSEKSIEVSKYSFSCKMQKSAIFSFFTEALKGFFKIKKHKSKI